MTENLESKVIDFARDYNLLNRKGTLDGTFLLKFACKSFIPIYGDKMIMSIANAASYDESDKLVKIFGMGLIASKYAGLALILHQYNLF